MLPKNDKITSRNRGVEKAHCKHQGCYVGHENFPFRPIKNIKMCRVICIGYNVDSTIKSSHLFCTRPFGGVWGRGARASNFLNFCVCSMFSSCPASSQNYSPTCSRYHHTFIPWPWKKTLGTKKITLDFFSLLVALWDNNNGERQRAQ
jgi:hypothetical protein